MTGATLLVAGGTQP